MENKKLSMIYKGMEYALPATTLSKELNYTLQITQQLIVNDKEDNMLIELTCRIIADVQPHQYLLFLADLIINGKAEGDYDKQEWLFARLFSINSNLIIKTDQYGAIIGVGDKKRILSEWELAKTDINAVYESGEIDELLNSMDYALNNDMKMYYHHDQLLNLIFNNIYQTYTSGESMATEKMILKHFGVTALPVIEYKELSAIDESLKTATVDVYGQISELFTDTDGMNNYLAEVTRKESDQEMDYYFDYQGWYKINLGEEHYITQAEMTISGECEGYKKLTVYHLMLKP